MEASQEISQDLRVDRLQDMAALPWDTAALRVQEALAVANRLLMASGTNLHRARTSTMDLVVISLEKKVTVSTSNSPVFGCHESGTRMQRPGRNGHLKKHVRLCLI